MLIRLLCRLALLGLVATSGAAAEATPHLSATPHATGTPMEFDSFIVVLLVRPPNAPDFPEAELNRLGEGHMANIGRLASEGKLLKAGPFEDYSGRNVRGMFILNTDSQDQAREWVATDPLVKAGRGLAFFHRSRQMPADRATVDRHDVAVADEPLSRSF